MTINERFFNLLDKSGISQKRIANDIGVSEKTISAWRSRKSDPPANIITTIADFFNVSLEFLLTGNETESTANVNCNTNDKLALDERMLIDTYREMTDNGKTQLLNVSRKIWADYPLSVEDNQPKSKSQYYPLSEKNVEDAG